jgi:hypothetical protein
MAQYSQDDRLNELSQLLRGRVEPTKEGGVVDPAAIHAQIMEIARTVFLLNPGALFYLARLVRNSMLFNLKQEIAVLEDMLLAIDDLVHVPSAGQISQVSQDDLSNAQTALLALEFAGSVKGRPELLRYQRIMDKFVGQFRPNIVDAQGNFILPRGEARQVLRENLESLKYLHAVLLQILDGMIGLVEEFNDLDIPTLVSQTALINVRKQLLSLQNSIEESTEEQLISDSRLIVLRSLASKVVVALLAQFNQINLTTPKLTSDNTGAASDPNAPIGPFLAKAAGEGTSASVITSPGPWRLDELSSSLISLKIDDGLVQTIDLSVIQGPGIHGKNKVPFTNSQLYPVWPGPGGPTDPPPPPKEDYSLKPNLHIIVDTNNYEFVSEEWGHVDITGTFHPTVNAPPNQDPDLQRGEPIPGNLIDSPRSDSGNMVNDYWNTVRMQPPVKLGFKHLGCLMFLSLGEVGEGSFGTANKGAGFGGWDVDGQDTLDDASEWSDLNGRRWDYIFRPRTIYDLELLASVTLTHIAGGLYSVATNAAEPHWVGFYLRTGTNHATYERYEIISVESDGSTLEVDLRGDSPSVISGSTQVFGQRGDRSQITFFPDLLADTDKVADSAVGDEHGPATVPNTAGIKVSSAVKTARIPSGQGGTITSVINALSNPSYGDYDSLNNKYQHASYHCMFKDQNGFGEKITVQGRSRLLPEELQISDTFFKTYMFLPPTGSGEPREENPGPVSMVIVKESGHEVFGFDIGQKADPKADPFLSVEELDAVVKDSVDSATTDVEIVETDVFGGFLSTIPGTFDVQDSAADFTELGVGLGFLLEIQEGNNSGVYFVESSSGSFLSLARHPDKSSTGFVGAEINIAYRIFTQQLRISSKNNGAGSSVEVTSAPTQLQLPSSIVYGIVPSIEAVNANGDNLSLSGLSPGDTSGALVVDSVSSDGTKANIVGGVSSSTLNLRFSFDGKTESTLAKMISDLTTIKESKNLLARNGFDKNVDKIDAVLTSLVTPGQSFQSNLNQARVVIASLLGVLTNSPPLESYYTAQIPDLSPDIESSITPYDAPAVRALDALLDSLNEHGFDRALSLLLSGRLADFFSTTPTTSSFSGALLETMRTSAQDVQGSSLVASSVASEMNTGYVVSGVKDSDSDYSDTEDQFQDSI